MTRIIACVSGKGGVGKTTIVSNLGVALAALGKNVIVVDTNLTTPNLGIHFGMPLYPTTIHDVLKGTASIRDAIYHHDSGVKIVPAGLSLRDLRGVDSKDLPNVLLDLLGSADMVLLDSSAGLGKETLSSIEAADEMMVITSPELTSVADALKASKLAQQLGTKVIGAAINRVSGKPHEMRTEDVQNMLGDAEILAKIPEHIDVQKAIAKRNPVVLSAPNSPASREIRKLAGRIAGIENTEKLPWYRFLFR
ncbi:MAG: P-loop NTPase [Candidatus Aenigmarchaeota archaeon]|nr:P-loop NTPase [Candidatus Aenigmarchaeota archaeon]